VTTEQRAAVIRLTPEQMTKLLALPDGNRVIRFQVVGTMLHCLVAGPAFAIVRPGEGGPLIIEIDTIRNPG
jgi:hypothetical protein